MHRGTLRASNFSPFLTAPSPRNTWREFHREELFASAWFDAKNESTVRGKYMYTVMYRLEKEVTIDLCFVIETIKSPARNFRL